MQLMMTRNKILFIVASTFAIGTGVIIVLFVMPVRRSYSVTAAGLEMPQLDRELESWLKDQPGVIANSVSIKRNFNNNLNISLEMSQSIFGLPKFPDVDAKCSEMGYRFKTDRFFHDPHFD